MKDCFGHDGSTGVMAQADKKNGIVIAVMNNRGHPDVKNSIVNKYKAVIENTVMKVLGYS